MSGICGFVVHSNYEEVIPAYLSPMLEALSGRTQKNDSIVTLTAGPVGIGIQQLPGHLAGITKTTVHGYPLVLAFYGSLYNLSDILTETRETDPLQSLLALYLREGQAWLQRLRGEFALALWDGLEEALYLATDRFRVHPLYYYYDQDKLVFASRLKGILACPFSVTHTVNLEAIVDVVATSLIPTPKTIFREVYKLPPGHLLRYYRGEVQLTSYWDISFLHPDEAEEKELAQRLKTVLADAIAVRSAVDGISERIGTFMSGGIDSSTVTGVLTQFACRPIKSFSIGFSEQRFNEIEYARVAARAFGCEHYEYFVTPQDTYDAIPVILNMFDEPFANASTIPVYFCAKLAREHGVEVLYAGDGGDELFAGNERYATQRVFDDYQKIPPWCRKLLLEPLLFTLAKQINWDLLRKGIKYIQRANTPYPDRLSAHGLFEVMPMTELFDEDLLETIRKDYDPYAALNHYYFQAPALSELDRQLYIDLKLAITDNDLLKVTRMTEAAGVLVRFPFLDHQVAEFAASIPATLKMRGRQLRSFFKKAYADLLPAETRAKQKHGFGLPIPIWLRTDQCLKELMHELLLSPQSIQRGYFRKKAVEKLVEYHKTDKTSFYGTVLWNLMILELWHRHHSTSLQ
jgi:asparagine synthase (glutamine-hydrolysing)